VRHTEVKVLLSNSQTTEDCSLEAGVTTAQEIQEETKELDQESSQETEWAQSKVKPQLIQIRNSTHRILVLTLIQVQHLSLENIIISINMSTMLKTVEAAALTTFGLQASIKPRTVQQVTINILLISIKLVVILTRFLVVIMRPDPRTSMSCTSSGQMTKKSTIKLL